MKTELNKYMKLKRRVEESQREADKAEGALQQVMKRLKKEFGCSTLEDAEKKLRLLGKQQQKTEDEFENAIEEFKEKWK